MWAPTPAEAVQLALGEARVEWSHHKGWRVVPMGEGGRWEPEYRRPAAQLKGRTLGAHPVPSEPLTPAEIKRRWPAAARHLGIR